MRQSHPSEPPPATPSLGRQAWRFVRDFALFGGRRTVLAALLVALGAVAEGVGILLLIPLLTILTGGTAGSGWFGRMSGAVLSALPDQPRLGPLAVLLAGFGVLMAVRAVVILMRDVAMTSLQSGFVEAQRLGLTRRLAATSWATINTISHARVAHLMSTDIQRCGVAANFVLQCGVAAAMLAAQVGLAFLLSPPLAAMSLGLLAVAVVLLKAPLRSAHANGDALSKGQMALTRDTGRFLGGLKQAFSQNREAAFVAEVKETLDDLGRFQIRFVRQRTLARMVFTTLAALVAGAALLVGHGVLNLAPSVLMTLLFVLARTSGPATQIQQGALQLVNALPAYDLVRTLDAELDAAARPPAGPPALLPPADAPVTFAGVGFDHTPDGDTRHGVSLIDLTLRAGDFVGLSGPSGAGKTTFVDLLAGLYPPQSGEIRIGDQRMSDDLARAWRDAIAYVPQDPYLLNDTVRRNLLWSAPEAGEAEIWNALALAEADALVRRMDQGLDTLIGERGARLSGGERQRLALAAAILRRPRMMILDEATSAIDVGTEDAILARLRAACPTMTLVIVAHRTESLARCDRVLTLDQGRLAGDERRQPAA